MKNSSNRVPSHIEALATCRGMIGDGTRLGQFSQKQQRAIKEFMTKALAFLVKPEKESRIERKTLKQALHLYSPPKARINSLTFAMFSAAKIPVVFDEHWYKDIFWVDMDELRANIPKLEALKTAFQKAFYTVPPISGQKRKQPSVTETKTKSPSAPSVVVKESESSNDSPSSPRAPLVPSTAPAHTSFSQTYNTQSVPRQPDISKLTYEVLPSMQILPGTSKAVPGIIFHFNCSVIVFEKFHPQFQTVFKEYSNGFQWKSTLVVSTSIRPNQGWLTLGEPLSAYSAVVEIDLTGMHPNTQLIPEDPARQRWLIGTVVLECDDSRRGGMGVFVPTARDVIAQARSVNNNNLTKPKATIEPLSESVLESLMPKPVVKKKKSSPTPISKESSP